MSNQSGSGKIWNNIFGGGVFPIKPMGIGVAGGEPLPGNQMQTLSPKRLEELAGQLTNQEYYEALCNADYHGILPSTKHLAAVNVARSMNSITSATFRKQAIAMRLRVEEGARWPFDFLETHLCGEQVAVFLVVGDKPVTVMDDAHLFPSDTLVAQLNLLKP